MKNMPSPETQQAMADFFMRTSVPRILEERRLKELEKEEEERKSEDGAAFLYNV